MVKQWLDAATPRTAAVLPRALRASRFLGRVLERQREWALAALAAGRFESAATDTAARRLAEALDSVEDTAGTERELRRFRNRELARLALRDIAGWAKLDETLLGLSDVAEAACGAALEAAHAALAASKRRALAGVAPIVLGMGKLGGRELNFSSDVDLIFAYAAPQAAGDAGPAEVQEPFGRLVHGVVDLLSKVTEDGFVYRVDTLLRPFGAAGAAALSTAAMTSYYQTHGREWERYALIKARPVAGDLGAGRILLEHLQPFVYRRYLDFGAFDALRDIKQRIDADARRHGLEDDIKLGTGGIRELEFIVQLFQLVRGGQDARLRGTCLRPTLAQLGAVGLLDATTVAALDDAYVFLRRTENALQFHDDQQTQALPADAEGREALCAALDFPDWAAFQTRLAAVRSRVRETFEQVFAGHGAQPEVRSPHGEALWAKDGEELAALLRERGFRRQPEQVAERLTALRDSRTVRLLGDAARERLHACVADLVADAAKLPDPELALCRTLEVIAAIGGRSTYFSLLRESGVARRQLLRLTAASPWITRTLAQTPALLDVLLDPRLADALPDRAALFQGLALRAGGVDAQDTEACMELLRRYRQESMLRIAVNDLAGELPLVQVSDRLTWLAEAVVGRAVVDASTQLSARYGRPARADGRGGAFAAVAYGKFGSIELGYGSDLDLVFVYDIENPGAPTRGGSRSLSAAEYYNRLAQRVVQLLSALTGSGRAYEIDLALRPSGSGGAAVTSFEGWARYQRRSAWTWEHQALLRARPVASDSALSAAVDAVRREVLVRPREAAKLRAEVVAMRHKMRAGLEKRATGQWDVKQGEGGLVDAEFLTQYLLLCNAAREPALVAYTDNWRQLEALASAGVMPREEVEALLTAGRSFRTWLHRQALQEDRQLAAATEFAAERAAVRRLWVRYMEEGA
ncbi:MAG TPA: bifunctional [glutamate--ammonia ligase]-adenylyl-L-tyrosine phosphorylase/[glutamate--ammonia-ligase] adenylyltransferase [Nevskiaceae bacterium]